MSARARDGEDDDETLSQLRSKLIPSGTASFASSTKIDRSSGLSSNKSSLRRPLIDQVDNKWRKDEKVDSLHDPSSLDDREPRICDFDDDESCPNVTYNTVISRRFRRMFSVVLLLVLGLYYLWTRYLRPHIETEWTFKEGFVNLDNGTYGLARGGDFDGVRLLELDPKLLPGGNADPKGHRRLVFIGDVHGCFQELKELLKKVDFREDSDHLILTGDVVSKGPDNVAVLDELIRLKATSVRGNHEDRLITAADSMVSADTDLPTEAGSSKGASKDAALLKEMKPHHLRYMRDMPLMLHVPPFPLARHSTSHAESPIKENLIVVHAGLVPGVPLDRQDPYFVMNMRSIHRKSHVPSAVRASRGDNSKPWIEFWNWYSGNLFRGVWLQSHKDFENAETEPVPTSWLASLQTKVFGARKHRPHPQVVVYGHDSKAGLQMKRWSKGLDSACVSGGELTAFVLEAKGTHKTISVKCENYRQ